MGRERKEDGAKRRVELNNVERRGHVRGRVVMRRALFLHGGEQRGAGVRRG